MNHSFRAGFVFKSEAFVGGVSDGSLPTLGSTATSTACRSRFARGLDGHLPVLRLRWRATGQRHHGPDMQHMGIYGIEIYRIYLYNFIFVFTSMFIHYNVLKEFDLIHVQLEPEQNDSQLTNSQALTQMSQRPTCKL